MSDLQRAYDAIAYGGDDSPPPWIQEDAAACGCRGTGWYSSPLDTFHRCPLHYNGQRHPEDYSQEEAEEAARQVQEYNERTRIELNKIRGGQIVEHSVKCYMKNCWSHRKNVEFNVDNGDYFNHLISHGHDFWDAYNKAEKAKEEARDNEQPKS